MLEGGATLLSSHAGTSQTGDERHSKRRSDRFAADSLKESQLAAGPDHLLRVGHRRQERIRTASLKAASFSPCRRKSHGRSCKPSLVDDDRIAHPFRVLPFVIMLRSFAVFGLAIGAFSVSEPGLAAPVAPVTVSISRFVEAGPVVAGGRLVWVQAQRDGALAVRRSSGNRAETVRVFRPSAAGRSLIVREFAASGDRFVFATEESGPGQFDVRRVEILTGAGDAELMSLAKCAPRPVMDGVVSDLSVGVSAGRVVYRVGECGREGLSRFLLRDFRAGHDPAPQRVPVPDGTSLDAFGGPYLVTRGVSYPDSLKLRITNVDTGDQRVLAPLPRSVTGFGLSVDDTGRAVAVFGRQRTGFELRRVTLPRFVIGKRLATSGRAIVAEVSGQRVVITRESKSGVSTLEVLSPTRRALGLGGAFDLQGNLLGYVTGCRGRTLRLVDLREPVRPVKPRCRHHAASDLASVSKRLP